MPSITSVIAGASTTVQLALMRGNIARLGQDGYAWQYAGLGSGETSNSRSNVTQHKADQSTVEAWAYADSKPELNTSERSLVMMRYNDCSIVDQFGELREVILHAAQTNITEGRYAYNGKTYPFMMHATLTVEAIK